MMLRSKFKKITVAAPIGIFFICIIIYFINGATISAGDTVPNTLLVFNLLENHTFNFDIFRESYFCVPGRCYFFVKANHGHLSSAYPIGTAIITFPLYLIFYIYLKLVYFFTSVPLDLTSVSFEAFRLSFEKIAATITTATTVTIFYLSNRLKFSKSISLISTLIIAFATNTWMTSSQGIWQHTASNLVLTVIIFCLLKANRTSEKSQKIWLVIAGVACGLIPGIRPPNTLYTIAAIVYSIFTYRFKSIYLLFGLISAIPSIIWNLYYFSNFTGGYSKLFSGSPYEFTFNNFISATLGTLVSPSRGLLIFSPIVLYFLPGAYQVFKSRAGKDEKLIGCLTIASLLLLFSYCGYKVWWAGHSYGPRFMTDIMPIGCYLISYFLTSNLKNSSQSSKILGKKSLLVFIALIIFSTFTQALGAFGVREGRMWNAVPLSVDKYQYRLWSWQDSQIERNAKAVFYKFFKLPIDNSAYIQGLAGKIKQITDESNQPLSSLFSVEPGATKTLKAKLENTGTSRWFGYESALEKGEVQVRCRFHNDRGEAVSESPLYVSGILKQHELPTAIGSVTFPKKPGTYELVFDLVSADVGDFPNYSGKPLYELSVNVGDQKPKDSQLLSTQVFAQAIKVLNDISTIKVGSTLKIPVFVKNKSNFLWSNVGLNPTNFSYKLLDTNGELVSADGERSPLPYDVAPGESVTLNAIMKTPKQPGKYKLILTMVQENVAWFNDRGAKSPEVDIEVVSQ